MLRLHCLLWLGSSDNTLVVIGSDLRVQTHTVGFLKSGFGAKNLIILGVGGQRLSEYEKGWGGRRVGGKCVCVCVCVCACVLAQ